MMVLLMEAMIDDLLKEQKEKNGEQK
jgi:hypothetical protein